jgi:hypothetical protein
MIAALILATVLVADSTCGASGSPDSYVLTPNIERGEVELEYRMGAQNQAGAGSLEGSSLALGYAPTSWWGTEVYAKFRRRCGASVQYDAVEWENRIRFTKPGRHALDVGAAIEFELPADRSEGVELAIGPLLQSTLGRWQLNANVLFAGSIDATAASPTQLGYQWQARYRWKRAISLGAQAFGDVGTWDHWSATSAQSHLLGPALFGNIVFGDDGGLDYDAAMLWGLTAGSPDTRFRLQLEFEF